jgi:hypothetical protein
MEGHQWYGLSLSASPFWKDDKKQTSISNVKVRPAQKSRGKQ